LTHPGRLKDCRSVCWLRIRQSVDDFAVSRRTDPYDYSRVNFLAKRVTIFSALSPRSFVVSRAAPASTAPLPFIGFAEHLPIAMTGRIGEMMISVGNGCSVELSAIAALTNQLSPIKESELLRAAAALRVVNPPSITGAAFTDSAVKARNDLDQFQILHFATHGLTEGQWGCAKSPPALVTSLGDEDSDSILSFSEIARLKLNANLVVLSACDTASGVTTDQARAEGQEESGATLEGLVRAFLTANARAVLSTYWAISDEGESEALIENFYRAGRTSNIATALRTAQTGTMSDPRSSHPIFWGAFFVVGDASKLMCVWRRRASGGNPRQPEQSRSVDGATTPQSRSLTQRSIASASGSRLLERNVIAILPVITSYGSSMSGTTWRQERMAR
jgi:CHAT domain-containing protein